MTDELSGFAAWTCGRCGRRIAPAELHDGMDCPQSTAFRGIATGSLPYVVDVPPKPQSTLRLVAGSDAVCILHPSKKPNIVVRLLTRWLLRMEWLDGPSAGTPHNAD